MPKEKQHPEYQYLGLLEDILVNGQDKELFFVPEVLKQYEERGEKPPFIRSVFGRMMRFDLSQGFPLLTTKKVFWRGIVTELLWFLRGDTNIKYLVDNNNHIWDDWAYKQYLKAMEEGKVEKMSQEEFIAKIAKENAESEFVKKWGDLGLIYGAQWRRWPASDGRKIDQLTWAIKKLKKTPYRKSIVVSTWNPEYMYEMAAPGKSMVIAPCHMFYQFNVSGDKLSLLLFQRSADMFLGVPFNIASYSLLLMMVAQVVGMEPGEFVHTFGDAHIYSNHFDAVKEQLKRDPKPFPQLELNPAIKNIDDFRLEDIDLKNYQFHSPLKAKIANVGGF